MLDAGDDYGFDYLSAPLTWACLGIPYYCMSLPLLAGAPDELIAFGLNERWCVDRQ